jgi:hypothetical protein
VSSMIGSIADDNHTPALRIITSTIPIDMQFPIRIEPNLILEGRICSSTYVDDSYNCTFDRATITGMETTKTAVSRHMETKPDETVKDDCPICAFMKAGPCSAEFEHWSACMESLADADTAITCTPKTLAMTLCMQRHEYYDVFMAGMSEKLDLIGDSTTTEDAE